MSDRDPHDGWELAYTIRLDEATILLNAWQRMHWSARMRYKKKLMWLVRVTYGPPPLQPLSTCHVHLIRGNPKPFPDEEGRDGGFKPLLDVLSAFHEKVNPQGLGFILNDSPNCILLKTAESVATKPRQGFTKVQIYMPAIEGTK